MKHKFSGGPLHGQTEEGYTYAPERRAIALASGGYAIYQRAARGRDWVNYNFVRILCGETTKETETMRYNKEEAAAQKIICFIFKDSNRDEENPPVYYFIGDNNESPTTLSTIFVVMHMGKMRLIEIVVPGDGVCIRHISNPIEFVDSVNTAWYDRRKQREADRAKAEKMLKLAAERTSLEDLFNRVKNQLTSEERKFISQALDIPSETPAD